MAHSPLNPAIKYTVQWQDISSSCTVAHSSLNPAIKYTVQWQDISLSFTVAHSPLNPAIKNTVQWQDTSSSFIVAHSSLNLAKSGQAEILFQTDIFKILGKTLPYTFKSFNKTNSSLTGHLVLYLAHSFLNPEIKDTHRTSNTSIVPLDGGPHSTKPCNKIDTVQCQEMSASFTAHVPLNPRMKYPQTTVHFIYPGWTFLIVAHSPLNPTVNPQ